MRHSWTSVVSTTVTILLSRESHRRRTRSRQIGSDRRPKPTPPTGKLCSQFRHGIHAYDRQSCAAQRCSVVGPAVLRRTGVNFVGARWVWASPLFSLGIAPDRVYRLRAEDRAYPRGNRRGTQLQRMKDGLTQCIGCGCLSIDKCKLANPADRAGRRGPGPRYWLG